MLAVTPLIMDANYSGNEFPKARMDVLKKSMTLNFGPGTNGGLLDSPDLRMVQLTSPDLENLIFQQSGILLQTPTPGALVRMISFREDEKPDLRGFEEALAKMQSQRNAESLQQFATEGEYSLGQAISSESQPQVELVYSGAPAKRPFNEAIIENAASTAPAKQPSSTFASSAASNDDDSQCSSVVSAWSEEESYAQRSVPRGAMRTALDASGSKQRANGQRHAQAYASHKGGSKHTSSMVEPVDLNSQDRMRVERKRERNRVAARKCRERKIRKIDELTNQVEKLESDKKGLAVRLTRLQAEISRLRGAIQEHAHSGCKVPLGTR